MSSLKPIPPTQPILIDLTISDDPASKQDKPMLGKRRMCSFQTPLESVNETLGGTYDWRSRAYGGNPNPPKRVIHLTIDEATELVVSHALRPLAGQWDFDPRPHIDPLTPEWGEAFNRKTIKDCRGFTYTVSGSGGLSINGLPLIDPLGDGNCMLYGLLIMSGKRMGAVQLRRELVRFMCTDKFVERCREDGDLTTQKLTSEEAKRLIKNKIPTDDRFVAAFAYLNDARVTLYYNVFGMEDIHSDIVYNKKGTRPMNGYLEGDGINVGHFFALGSVRPVYGKKSGKKREGKTRLRPINRNKKIRNALSKSTIDSINKIAAHNDALHEMEKDANVKLETLHELTYPDSEIYDKPKVEVEEENAYEETLAELQKKDDIYRANITHDQEKHALVAGPVKYHGARLHRLESVALYLNDSDYTQAVQCVKEGMFGENDQQNEDRLRALAMNKWTSPATVMGGIRNMLYRWFFTWQINSFNRRVMYLREAVPRALDPNDDSRMITKFFRNLNIYRCSSMNMYMLGIFANNIRYSQHDGKCQVDMHKDRMTIDLDGEEEVQIGEEFKPLNETDAEGDVRITGHKVTEATLAPRLRVAEFVQYRHLSIREKFLRNFEAYNNMMYDMNIGRGYAISTLFRPEWFFEAGDGYIKERTRRVISLSAFNHLSQNTALGLSPQALANNVRTGLHRFVKINIDANHLQYLYEGRHCDIRNDTLRALRFLNCDVFLHNREVDDAVARGEQQIRKEDDLN